MTHRSAIVDRLGTRNAAALSAIAGGTRLTVPNDLSASERFERRIGRALAVLVILHFGGSRIYVPRGEQSGPVDVRKVRRLVAAGHSSAAIARKLGCSERTVDAKRAKLRSRAKASATRSERGITHDDAGN